MFLMVINGLEIIIDHLYPIGGREEREKRMKIGEEGGLSEKNW